MFRITHGVFGVLFGGICSLVVRYITFVGRGLDICSCGARRRGRWEDGTRRPSAAAAKLIWLLHFVFVENEDLVNLYDWVSWGNGVKEAADW